jgi:putative heme-binding domain-containing protein
VPLVTEDNDTTRSARDLVAAILAEPQQELSRQGQSFREQLACPSLWARRASVVGLIQAGEIGAVHDYAKQGPAQAVDFLIALRWLNQAASRDGLRADVVRFTAEEQPIEVRRQAIRSLATIESQAADSCQLCFGWIDQPDLRGEAISALLLLPASGRNPDSGRRWIPRLVELAEATPIAQRTSDAFIDLVQLAESLMGSLPGDQSRALRERLRAIAVRVVRIRTVEEEMRYDLKFFAVEAGKPVEIVLKNEDLMPHNLVITVPGALKEVAFAAAKMPPDAAPGGKQYVPEGSQVLQATGMVPAGKQERLAFSAPTAPGEYPFVCTFPNHWMRMYGVMIVVSDLDAWQKSPTTPADPIGNNRSFVRKWTVADLQDQLAEGLRGRAPAIGERLFKEATCQQCHKLRGAGGIVGPDLTDVAQRWKQDTRGILQEVLEPSHKIDPKYAVQSVLTTDGKVYSGIIIVEDKDKVALLTSPEQTEPTQIPRADIDEIVKSSKSIMPIGLLDQYTQDEIFELMAYLVQ